MNTNRFSLAFAHAEIAAVVIVVPVAAVRFVD